MEKLTFNTGLKEYDVNGYVIRLNPTDTDFAKRVTAAIERMGDTQKRYSELGEQALPEELPPVDYTKAVMDADAEEMGKADQLSAMVRERLTAFNSLDAELAAEIDALFGDGAAAGIFGGISLTAFAGGLPVWMNFLTAVLEKFEESAREAAEAEEDNLRRMTEKYTGKYTQTREVYRKRRSKGKRRH